MGRHSRRGPVAKGDSAETAAAQAAQEGRQQPDPAPEARQAQGAVPPGQRRSPAGAGPAPTLRRAEGAPPRGASRPADATPAHGVPRLPDGTPARGVPRARGGHPEQREPGGGWGELGARPDGPRVAGPGVTLPRQRQASPAGPRQDYVEAFDEDDVFTPRTRGPERSAPERPAGPGTGGDGPGGGSGAAAPADLPEQARGAKGRTFTGIAAAAVTTVLAVVVAGQVADGRSGAGTQAQAATDQPASAGPGVPARASGAPGVAVMTYDQKMAVTYPLSATLKGSGRFETVPGSAAAPGRGHRFTYRVDVEQGLGLDGQLFAQAVQKTLNDDRSWAHGGARTFARVSTGRPDFVITLASPGTTAAWCAKSGLDTTEDNVSCDSAATERVMINAYRWAQGSKTYGDAIHAYRQMLINHEVGHRLGHGHVTCEKNGELAPVMQQQTKFLDHDGIHCLPNPWPYPRS
ncbi:DUF3152 domain-containing protein [Streptomyces tropicalis]|uniref:DUF3152 domain-containing protein n=1 Tax=Streptomyces tropicalis TaxID=3034234 RepID=A0ABT6A055_9ACTN|nr:DUF3152 domain-containing protein [Streptomyces tropicalis]MDF3298018.1 DUF3152 domain-containing protein [Streptomyces tropicalis]